MRITLRMEHPMNRSLSSRAVSKTVRPSAKRRINLTMRADILERARAAGLNLSQLAEDAIIQRLRESEWQRWREENAEAIKAYNERIERDGPWNKDLLRF
jgi:antitoxin CcdA